MNGSKFMQGWVTFEGLLATIAIILVPFDLMLGIVKPADAVKRIGTTLGVVIVLTLIPGVLVCIWSNLTLWRRLALAAVGLALWQWRRSR